MARQNGQSITLLHCFRFGRLSCRGKNNYRLKTLYTVHLYLQVNRSPRMLFVDNGTKSFNLLAANPVINSRVAFATAAAVSHKSHKSHLTK